jgi:tetratricopeptide (TPR) repeat protein
MKFIPLMFCLGTIVFFSSSLTAQTPDSAFSHGNELYRAGKYQEAANVYDSIIKQGLLSAELYFNLGNAYYRDRQLARAVLSYERAAQLHPNDPDIEHNLKLSYLRTVDRLEPVPDMFLIQWMHAVGSLMSSESVRMIFLLSWIVLFGSLAAMYLVLRPGMIRVPRRLFFISCALVLLSAAMLGIQSIQDKTQDKAIIVAQTVTAKSSPDTKAVDAFVIHEGLKIKLTDAVGEWVKVTLVDGKIGWILSEQCERI